MSVVGFSEILIIHLVSASSLVLERRTLDNKSRFRNKKFEHLGTSFISSLSTYLLRNPYAQNYVRPWG